MATFKGWLIAVLVLFMLANGALAVIPLFIGKFVAVLSAPIRDQSAIYWHMGYLLGLSMGHDILWRAAEYAYLKKINARSFEYENILFRNVINNKYPYFVGKFTGKLSSYLQTLGSEYKGFTENVFYNYADYVIKVPILIYTMFSVNTYTGLMFVVSLLILFLTGRITIRRSLEAEKVSADVGSSMTGYMIDVIANFVSVKAFRKEAAEFHKIETKRRAVVKASSNSFFWSMVFWGSQGLIVRSLIWPATIAVNTMLFIRGEINLAQMTTFLSAILLFSEYVWNTIWNISQFSLKLARMEEAHTYLFGARNVMQRDAALQKELVAIRRRKPLVFAESLTLERLSFAYPDKKDRTVLNNIQLHIKKNEKVGIVGRSGGGKTTLIKILLGYYKVPNGKILLDGKAVDNERLAELISYVPQDTSLFHRSLFDNIAYTADHIDESAVKQAARRAHAEEFILTSPDGYNTLVGERGIRLSMGQRQRIAIARAFLDDKELLVLDEATSALDSESEVLIQQALEDLWHGKTVIAIAHRLSTLRNMDRIVVIDNGVIVEQGSHAQLLRKKGHYAKLWHHQSGGILTED